MSAALDKAVACLSRRRFTCVDEAELQRAVAAALDVRDGTVREARLALGGVATKPWRAREAEKLLVGGPATEEAFSAAATAELAPAVGRPQNEFKIELARRTVVATLRELLGGTA